MEKPLKCIKRCGNGSLLCRTCSKFLSSKWQDMPGCCAHLLENFSLFESYLLFDDYHTSQLLQSSVLGFFTDRC